MHPQVRKLLELQQLDQKIASIRRDLDSLPAETARRRAALDAKRREEAAREAELRDAEVRSRDIDLATRQADDEIKKLDGRLNAVKNNAEYQATLLQIESVRRERDRMQEEGLMLLDRIESLRAGRDEARAQASEEQAVFDRFEEEAAALRRQREADVAEVAGGRAALLDGIPGDVLDRYEKLFRSRANLAVCAVDQNVCQGCYTALTMNDLARLRGGSSMVACGSCDRILYLANEA